MIWADEVDKEFPLEDANIDASLVLNSDDECGVWMRSGEDH